MRRYQYYNSGDDGDNDVYSNNWGAQTFTPETNHIIGKVKLKLFRVGTPGTLQVGIRATTGGKPTGGDLCSGEIDADTLTTNTDGEWYEISLGDGFDLDIGDVYAIVIRAVDGDASNKVSWRADESAPTYSEGKYCSSSDSGGSWGGFSGEDALFEEWGVGPPSPTTVTWSNLAKSQISSETIEEAIARMIQEHENDSNAHTETGESLQSHKAAEVIDHVVDSIIRDKIKRGEVSWGKLATDEQVMTENFGSGNWSEAGPGIFQQSIAEGVISIIDKGDYGAMYVEISDSESLLVDFSHSMMIQAIARFASSPNTAEAEYYVIAGNTVGPGLGFYVKNNSLYAWQTITGTTTKTEITGYNLEEYHVYRAQLDHDAGDAKFYVDGNLEATHTSDLPNSYDDGAGFLEVIGTNDDYADLYCQLFQIVVEK